MVQLKYFGDSRDYFKYDLITHILKCGFLNNYVFVPMLTDHRFDNEGNKLPRYIKGKSQELLKYIDSCDTKDLAHWRTWVSPFVSSYKTIVPVNEVFFSDSDRMGYWGLYENILKDKSALVFVDPDTGLETGTPGYLRRAGREKYILNEELGYLFDEVDEKSVLMIYQHLPNNKHVHKESVVKKIEQASSVRESSHVMAYREDDLAFIFMVKDKSIHDELNTSLNGYFNLSGHKYKSIHIGRI